MNKTPLGQILNGQFAWAARQRRTNIRQLTVRTRDFVDVDQSQPIPYFAGTVRTAGISITPVFELVSVDASDGGKGGGKAGGSQKNWSGSYGLAFGHGPCDVLEKIESGDSVVWEGPIFRADAMDGEGKTTLTTTVGTIHFYWGTDTQHVNPVLASLVVDQGDGSTEPVRMSAWPNIVLGVMEKIEFGSQENPPTLNFTMARFPAALDLSLGITRANLTDGGAGYVAPPTVSFAGDGSGAAGFATVRDGVVTDLTITDPGTGYSSPPTVTFSGGLQDETGAVNATATAHQQGGFVVSTHITQRGTLYAEPPTIAFSGGGGTGAAAIAVVNNGHVTDIQITDSGSGYTGNPTLTISGGRARDATASAFTFHELNGDCILPEAMYEMFTNTLFGCGIDPAKLFVQDFVDASNVCIAEDLGVSPYEDSTATMRELIGAWMLYIDGFIYFDNGLLGLKLLRTVDLGSVDSLDEDDFTEELQPENQGDGDLWSLTNLTFTDKENAWQTDGEPYDNPAAAVTISNVVFKQVDFPHIIRRSVAKQVVKRVGLRAGLPQFFYNVKVLPKHATIQIGQVLKLNYAKRGLSDVPVRVMSCEIGPPGEPEVTLKLMAEMTRSTINDYVIPEDFVVTPSEVDSGGSSDFGFLPASPRLMILPPGIKNNSDDGWLTGVTKRKAADRKGVVWFTSDPAIAPYKKRLKTKGFAVQGFVQMWHKLSTYGRGAQTQIKYNLRVKLASDIDLTGFNTLIDSGDDLYFVFGRRDVQLTGGSFDQHQVQGVWAIVPAGANVQQISTDTFDVEILTGQFSWSEFALETNADPAKMPTQICYFGTLDLFAIYKNNKIQFERDGGNGAGDDDRRRRVKFTAINKKKTEPLDGAVEVAYDRNDTTMHPDGTYLPDWGGRSRTTYEMVDKIGGEYFQSAAAINFTLIEDIDQALLRAFDGISSEYDRRQFNSVDQVLGVILLTGNECYNDNP